MEETEVLCQDVLDLAEELGIGDRIYAIMDVTREMFPGPMTAETGYDPEWPEDRWITLVVQVAGEMSGFIDKQSQWCDRIRLLTPEHWPAVGLSFF